MDKTYIKYVTPTQNLNLKMKVRYNHELWRDLQAVSYSRDSSTAEEMLDVILQKEADQKYAELVMEIKNAK